MKYILDQKEYDSLVKKAKAASTKNEKLINELCRRIANSEPVKVEDWTERGNKPWRCIRDDRDWCCDHCPVQDICTMSKRWSQ